VPAPELLEALEPAALEPPLARLDDAELLAWLLRIELPALDAALLEAVPELDAALALELARLAEDVAPELAPVVADMEELPLVPPSAPLGDPLQAAQRNSASQPLRKRIPGIASSSSDELAGIIAPRAGGTRRPIW